MLVDKLHEIGAIKFGQFTWTSGIQGPYYVDLRLVPSFPETFDLLTKELSKLVSSIPNYEKCALTGVPTAGIFFAAAVARALKLPLIYVRKQEKLHGTKKMIEGVLKPDQEVVIIEDLISKGGSVLKTVETLRAEGVQVNHVVATIDHGIGGKQNLEQQNIHLHTITTTLQAAEYLNKQGKLSGEELKTVKEFVNEEFVNGQS